MANESTGHIVSVPIDVMVNNLLPYLSLKEIGRLRLACKQLNSAKIQTEFFMRQQLFVIDALKAELDHLEIGELRDRFSIVITYMEKCIAEKNLVNLNSLFDKLYNSKIIDDSEETAERELNESLNFIISRTDQYQDIRHFLNILDDATKILLKRQPAYSLMTDGSITCSSWRHFAKVGVVSLLMCGGISSILMGIYLADSHKEEVLSKLLLGVGIPSTIIGAFTGTLSSGCIQKTRQRFCNFFRSQPTRPSLEIEAAQAEEPLFPGASANDESEDENEPLMITIDRYRNG